MDKFGKNMHYKETSGSENVGFGSPSDNIKLPSFSMIRAAGQDNVDVLGRLEIIEDKLDALSRQLELIFGDQVIIDGRLVKLNL